MECIDFEARLQDALDERRRPEADAALLEHLHGCPACRGLAQSLSLALDVVAGLPTPAVSTDISRRVLADLGRAHVVQFRSLRRWAALSTAAAVVAALSIPLGYWIGRQRSYLGDPGTLAARRSSAEDRPFQQPSDIESRLAEAFWNAPIGATSQPAYVGGETRWGQDVQTSLEPLTRSTAAALDSLWQAIPAAAEDSRS